MITFILRVLCLITFVLTSADLPAADFVFEDLVGFGGSSGTAEKVVLTRGGPQVTGEAFESGDGAVTAFVWDPVLGLIRLPHLSQTFPLCAGADLNTNGTVVGFCMSDTYQVIHAVRWDPYHTLFDLTPDCPWDCEAFGINNEGKAVGFWRNPESGLDQAVSWTDQTMTFLGTLGQVSIAYDISNKDQIVGESQLPDGVPQAVIYRKQGIKNLGTLGGYGSGAIAVNDKGSSTGTSGLPSGPSAAFFYSHNKMKPIPAPDNSDWAIGLDINEENQIVGQFTRVTETELLYHAFFWQPGMSQLADLNDHVQLPAGWVLYDARGVSDPAKKGGLPYIVGTVQLPDGTSRPYLLRPIQ